MMETGGDKVKTALSIHGIKHATQNIYHIRILLSLHVFCRFREALELWSHNDVLENDAVK